MADAPVKCQVADRIAEIRLNRPEARNALNSELLSQLPSVVSDADANPDVDVIILTGEDPAFCAGLDLKQLGSSGANLSGGLGDSVDAQGTWRGPFPNTTKPLIGAINGPAVTGGLELALACDFLIASERAKFADTHARVGLHPGWGMTVLLPQAIGIRRAREMSATGLMLDAETALAWGLVNHITPHDELLPYCRSLASQIIGAQQGALHEIYRSYDDATDSIDADGWEIERVKFAAQLGGAGFAPGNVADRRDEIIKRGSAQI